MNKQLTIGYKNKQGRTRDLQATPKVVLANHHLSKISGFDIGDKATVQYFFNQIIITKLTS